jgi:macrolide transport system ATP-binding/permease protein
MGLLIKDIKHSIRGLWKRPGFAAIAVLTLALGIGANTAIFSVVNALLLRPPSGVEKPEQLVLATWDNSGLGPSYPDYIDYRDRNSVLAGLATYSPTKFHLSFTGEAERLSGSLVSGNYFSLLGVKAVKGRILLPNDDTAAGANPVAVVSDALWRRRFNAEPNIVGQTIRLNGYPFTIVGVAAPEFVGVETGRSNELWIPVSMAGQVDKTLTDANSSRTARGWLRAFGRVKPNISDEQAQSEIAAIALTLAAIYPDTNKGVNLTLVPNLGLGPGQRKEALNFTSLLAAVAGLVLLIACANVANLLLARGQSRQKEIGIRLALGATRLRVIRQLLVESLLIALLGGLLGLFLAFWLSEPLRYFVAFGKGDYQALHLGLDKSVFAFTLLIAIVTGLIFGLIPALQATNTDLTPVLKNAARSGHGKLRIKLNELLVIGQIAISLVVLIAAGLFVRTLQKTQAVNPGFNAERVLTTSIDVGKQGYSEAQARQFYRQVVERIEALPGVRSVSMSYSVPLTDGTWNTRVRAANQSSDVAPLPVDYNIVTPRYFATMEIPFISGRDFSLADEAQAPGVVILNETLARRLFPNENPVGVRLTRFISGEPKFSLEVVGIVKDSKYQQLTEDPQPQMYLPSFQQYRPMMTLQVRGENNPHDLLAAVRREVQSLNGNLPTFNTRLLSDQLQASLSPQRSSVVLIGTFGLLALALASIGLYGVMAYTVSQHTREIGIRMALGAQSGAVLRLVVSRGMKLALIGVTIGLLAAFALTRLMRSYLFGVAPTDLLTYTTVAVVLLMIALIASYVPARRAMKVDPLVALRYE